MGFVTRNASPQNKLRGGVEFIDKVPISTSGKIIRDRRLLKEKEHLKSLSIIYNYWTRWLADQLLLISRK